jgi:RNA polymerase sigma factor (sigma-70 family)
MTATESDFDHRASDLGALAYRVAFRILGDREEARDVAQEALARAYAHWSRVGPYDEAWISRVAANLALDVARARGRSWRPDRLARLRRTAGPGAEAPDPAAAVVMRGELITALRRLSRRQREVVAMRYLADLPEGEVAAALGCSVGTVKQHASRGLGALRAALASGTQPTRSNEPTADASSAPVATSHLAVSPASPARPRDTPEPIAPEGAPS